MLAPSASSLDQPAPFPPARRALCTSFPPAHPILCLTQQHNAAVPQALAAQGQLHPPTPPLPAGRASAAAERLCPACSETYGPHRCLRSPPAAAARAGREAPLRDAAGQPPGHASRPVPSPSLTASPRPRSLWPPRRLRRLKYPREGPAPRGRCGGQWAGEEREARGRRARRGGACRGRWAGFAAVGGRGLRQEGRGLGTM